MDVFQWAGGVPTAIPVIAPTRDIDPRREMDEEQREAMRILDYLKAGDDIPQSAVEWALRTTGDAIGLR